MVNQIMPRKVIDVNTLPTKINGCPLWSHGGLGAVFGSIVTGSLVGLIEGVTKVVRPEASNTVVFVLMIVVLLAKPAGLFGESR